MPPIRILLASLPRLLSDVLTETIKEQPDMAVVDWSEGNGSEGGTLADAVVTSGADAVIIGVASDSVPVAYRDLLCGNPRLKVLAIVGEGRRGWLYEVGPHQVLLGQMSPSGLLARLRAAMDGGLAVTVERT